MDPSLYVILDRTAARGGSLEEILEAVIAGGGRMVQLREKEWPAERLLPLAERLRSRCREAGVTFVVNDRIDVALAVDADGVHVGQDDLSPRQARARLGPGTIVGVSTHSLDQALAAEAGRSDYIAVGSIFPTLTKPDFQLVGPGLIREVRPRVRAPLVGIGGITPENAGEVIRAGADGVAVVSAVCGAPDPAGVTRRFLEAIRAARAASDRAPERPGGAPGKSETLR